MIHTDLFHSYYFHYIFLFIKFAINLTNLRQKIQGNSSVPMDIHNHILADILCPMSEDTNLDLQFCFRFAHFLHKQIHLKFP